VAVGHLRAAADFSRVFLIGDSSGGNLVHLVAARANEDGPRFLQPVRLAGGVLVHPGFAREQKSWSELQNPPSLFVTQEMIDKLLPLALPLGATKDSPYTSPELAARAVAHVWMPPMLLMVAEDLLHDPQVDYGKDMVREGKFVKPMISRGDVGHVLYLNFFAVKADNLTAQRTTELVRTIKRLIIRH
jgi:acetyl esterase/lipase